MFGRGKKKNETGKAKTKTTNKKKDLDMEAIAKESKTSAAESTKNMEPKTKFTPYETTENEEYMNDKQLEHFKNILNAWKLELMQEVDETINELKEASTSVLADPNDRATQEETFSLELRTRDRERKLIKKIEEALQKIKDKDYGYCDACGIHIGIRRLEARPTANLCIDCKTLAEIKEKRA